MIFRTVQHKRFAVSEEIACLRMQSGGGNLDRPMNRASAAPGRLHLNPAAIPNATVNPRGIQRDINATYVQTQSKKSSGYARRKMDSRSVLDKEATWIMRIKEPNEITF